MQACIIPNLRKQQHRKEIEQNMKNVWKRIGVDLKQFLPIALLVALAWAIINCLFGAVCPSVLIAGLPCPGCGITRALFCFLTGKWKEAFWYNPLLILWIAGGVYFLFMRYVLGKKTKKIGIYFVAIILLSVVVYGIRMYLFFPSKEPLIYYDGNLIEKILPVYGNLIKGIGH